MYFFFFFGGGGGGRYCRGLTAFLCSFSVVCRAKINVGFALDGSNQMGMNNFASAIQLVANVSNYLHVETNKTWIFLTYGQQKKVFKTKSQLASLTPVNEAFPGTTNVYLGATLDAIKEKFNSDDSQRGAVNVVVLIASHTSRDDVGVPAAMLKTSNTTVFVLGVGTNYSQGQFREIASDPNGDHIIGLSSWSKVNSALAKTVARKICRGKWENMVLLNE